MLFYVTHPIGFESIVEKELKSFGCNIKEVRRGRIIFDAGFEDIPKLHYLGRTYERVLLLFEQAKIKNLDE